ncbi:1-hydroxycarotenoid 3,4-desaturase CrtD [Jannaschia sp. W003]|uniref:1-hydroxycarotenoid 3,4-desaturase CrtD n=1 Tax=Jannaschia sp. W003 TaxID=2867012 RepID=UPI0021A585FF|nr:1-hydroxycarotenoid 3,4-desaturase CrtD [Jannaschia sp. W003]UWQ21975.1 FAD-dependent oxidoreductase [Jannaschia sp. W003]
MDHVVVIGAGVGGLAAAMRLAHAGVDVTVLDRHPQPGGKMRAVDTEAGPVDCGPAVISLLPFLQQAFAACGAELEREVPLRPLESLGRHHWVDGSHLDLFSDYERTRAAVEAFAGPRAADQFARFHRSAEALFKVFEKPLSAAKPSAAGLVGSVARQPWLIPSLTPGRSMAQALTARFHDPRLRQLFGRHSTFLAGYPNAAPALMAVIWYAESQGAWGVEGGMATLARAMQAVAERGGARFRLGEPAEEIVVDGARATGVRVGGETLEADAVIHCGDPAALRDGMLGDGARAAAPAPSGTRGLSAWVWGFAARAEGGALAPHNVFHAEDPEAEGRDIALGRLPRDPTIYVCAPDRVDGVPDGPERFEILVNAPLRPGTEADPEESALCRDVVFGALERRGLRIDPRPPLEALTAPEDFNRLFPGSEGSLYGVHPAGLGAAFRRPQARTAVAGLLVAGGGAHPGAGLSLAALSGVHAAEAAAEDLAAPAPRAPARSLRASRLPGRRGRFR